MSENLKAKAEALITKLNKEKKFGLRLLNNEPEDIPRISTGSHRLDQELGGGWPVGRIVEVYGPPSSGKTTAATHLCIEAQKMGLVPGYIDVENALDTRYAQQLGLDLDALIYHQPKSAEEALQLVVTLVEEGISPVILDSVAGLVPQAELDGEIGDSHVGIVARLMGQTMRKLAPIVSKTKSLAFFINQTREKIGVMFGDPETTPGGKALEFNASVRMRLQHSTVVKDGDTPIGNDVNYIVKKNKTYRPHVKGKLRITYGVGFDKAYELAQIAAEKNAVTKKGGNHYINGERVASSGAEFEELLRSDPAVMEEVERRIREGVVDQELKAVA